MNEFKKLAIAGAVGALMMSASVAEAHVSYNLNASLANGNATGPWTGGAPNGYTGNLPATWVANVHNDTDPNAAYEVSQADAITEGAPSTFAVESLNNKWNHATSWGAAMDFGLIDLHVAGNLLIEVKADNSTFTPGFTLFSGWDTSATSTKHGPWNTTPVVNPLGSAGLTYLGEASTTTAGGSVSYLFTNLAAGNYSLWVGGNGTGNTPAGTQSYMANITASPVPLPGAVWLFGSAIAGLVSFNRRRQAQSA
ncbi:MAG: hypothetical protein ABL903_15515 [Methylococcales bacterium]